MACGTPFAKGDQVFAKRLGQGNPVHRHPVGQALELPLMRFEQILAAVLCTQQAVRPHRETEIGAIEFFLDDHLTLQQGARLLR